MIDSSPERRILDIKAKIARNFYPRPTGLQADTHVSIYYVLSWGLAEALRELTQNMIDEIHTKVEKENYDRHTDLRIVSPNNSTDFQWLCGKDGATIHEYGSITYDDELGRLTLKNPGAIPITALLLGGGTKTTAPPKDGIAGRFGEGMKLAVLAALREGKLVVIKTGGKRWMYSLCLRSTFGEPTLHYQITDDERAEPGMVVTEIHNISKEEWLGTPQNNQGVHCFLPLRIVLGERVDFVKPLNFPNHSKQLGTLLLGPHVRGKIFVKGIFICQPSGALELAFGYDFIDMQLDRDRNTTVNQTEQNEMTSQTLAHIFNNHLELSQIYPVLADNMIDMLGFTLEKILVCHQEVWTLHYHTSATTADKLLLRWWRSPKQYGREGIDWPWHNTAEVNNQIAAMGLSPGVYHTKYVSCHASANFRKANLFKNPAKFVEDLPKVHHAMTSAEEAIKDRVRQRLMGSHPQIPTLEFIFLEDAEYAQNYRLGNRIYLSHLLLDSAFVGEKNPTLAALPQPCELKIMGIVAKVMQISGEFLIGR